MFFRWGYNFVYTGEFDDYSKWEPPVKLNDLPERIKSVYKFHNAYYVWDAALIWSLVQELNNLYLMRIITTIEMEEIRNALKDMLSKMEKTLDGTHVPSIGLLPDTTFYVSNIALGFTNIYFNAAEKHFVSFRNNYSFSMINDNTESFTKLKDWSDSFKCLSRQLSGAGRIERKLFFDNQHRIIEQFLR